MTAVTLMASFCPATQFDAFKGDHDQFIDRLVVSSQKKLVDDSLLQERALVPFFEPSDSVNTSFEPLERRAQKAPFPQPHHGLKRNAGERSSASLSSSPKKEITLSAAKQRRGTKSPTAPMRGSSSDSESSATALRPSASGTFEVPSPARGNNRKHNRQTDAQPRRSPSPPHKREHLPSVDALAATLTPVSKYGPGKFAGPAFCNSPTPDSLPIPTLLMQQAADSLRARLSL